VPVSSKSIEEVLEAIKAVADAIAANTAVITGNGSTTTTTREPTLTQARAILDYLVVGELLARLGFKGRVVSALREGNIIHLVGVPSEIDGVPVNPKRAVVTPGVGGTAQTVDLKSDGTNPTARKVTLDRDKIPDAVAIIRIELQDDKGVPVALGPRLGPSFVDDDEGGVDVDLKSARRTS
jgi:hypothetical protein